MRDLRDEGEWDHLSGWFTAHSAVQASTKSSRVVVVRRAGRATVLMLCIGVLSFHAGLTLAGGWAFRDVAVACVGILVGALATTLLMLAPVRTEWSVAQVRVTRRGWPRLARSLQRPAAAELLNDADGTRVRIRNLAGQALEVRFARLAEARAFEREATSVIRSLHPD